MDYKIGDKVVYPNHGVGVVEQMSFGVLNGRTERYYMIRIISSGLRVMVPHTNAIAVGLRSVIRSNDTTKVLGFLELSDYRAHQIHHRRIFGSDERRITIAIVPGQAMFIVNFYRRCLVERHAVAVIEITRFNHCLH